MTQKNKIANPRIRRHQHDVAMTMKGTPIKYPKPTQTQQLKKWLQTEKTNVFILCACVTLIIAVSCTVTSPIIAFILSLFIGAIIGTTLANMLFPA